MAASEKQMHEDLLVAQILTLAGVLKESKERKGGFTSTADYISEAIELLRSSKAKVLEELAK